jgi:hypothetical protein
MFGLTYFCASRYTLQLEAKKMAETASLERELESAKKKAERARIAEAEARYQQR